MEANDMAACREALAQLRQRFDHDAMAYQDRYLKLSRWHCYNKAAEAAKWRDVFHELREVCDAALAKPPRNCDFGTAGEQAERCLAQFDQWRRKGDNRTLMAAIMEWTQAPYEGEAARD